MKLSRIFVALLFAALILACNMGTPSSPTINPPSQPPTKIPTISIPTKTSLTPKNPAIASTPTFESPPTPGEKPDLERYTPISSWYGQWRFVSYFIPQEGSDYAYVSAYVEEQDGLSRIIIEEGWQPNGLGVSFPNTYWWSTDGNTLFVANFGVPDGCSYFGFGTKLQKIDLETKEIIPIAQDVEGVFSIPPDGKSLAYLQDQAMIFRSLKDGSEQRTFFETPAGEFRAGDIHWSPSSDQVIFNVVTKPCTNEASFAFYTADFASATATIVLPFSQTMYTFETWTNGIGLILDASDGKRYSLDLQSGELVEYP